MKGMLLGRRGGFMACCVSHSPSGSTYTVRKLPLVSYGEHLSSPASWSANVVLRRRSHSLGRPVNAVMQQPDDSVAVGEDDKRECDGVPDISRCHCEVARVLGFCGVRHVAAS